MRCCSVRKRGSLLSKLADQPLSACLFKLPPALFGATAAKAIYRGPKQGAAFEWAAKLLACESGQEINADAGVSFLSPRLATFCEPAPRFLELFRPNEPLSAASCKSRLVTNRTERHTTSHLIIRATLLRHVRPSVCLRAPLQVEPLGAIVDASGDPNVRGPTPTSALQIPFVHVQSSLG